MGDVRRREVVYFAKGGPANTAACLDAVEAALPEGYRDVVVATTCGGTALALAQRFRGRNLNIVAVTHSAGFKNPNETELDPDALGKLRELGVRVYTGTILTHSIETCFAAESGGTYPTIIVAQSLRRLGQGTKVVCEIVMEACDAGLIEEGKEVIAVAGTGRGADTACIVKSAASKRFLSLKVLEYLAKPRE